MKSPQDTQRPRDNCEPTREPGLHKYAWQLTRGRCTSMCVASPKHKKRLTFHLTDDNNIVQHDQNTLTDMWLSNWARHFKAAIKHDAPFLPEPNTTTT
eukprot:17689-Amphidinium_carterae.2